MKEVILDSNIMTVGSRSGAYDVYYVLYYDLRSKHKDSIYIPEKPTKEYNIIGNYNKACFAGIKSDLSSYINPGPYCKKGKCNIPIPNRIYYQMNMNTTVKPKLKRTEKYTWLRLCKRHGLLPNYIVPSTVIKGKVVFDISETPPSLLYVYLSMMRAIVEYPAFVKAMVYLVNKLKMNFYAAFVYVSKLYITNYGHHIITPTKDYNFDSKTITNMRNIEVHLMIGLKRFSENPHKFDRRHITELCKTHWRCSDTIKIIPKLRHYINAPDLFKPNLEKVIEAETDSEAKNYLSKLDDEPQVKIVLKDQSIKRKK